MFDRVLNTALDMALFLKQKKRYSFEFSKQNLE